MVSRGKIILGITGVLGSGKSTACRFLAEDQGFHWIEADTIVHDLYQAGQPGYRKIQEYFGTQFVNKKEVSRSRLRRFVLQSQQKLWILNKLIHPLVAHEVNKKITQHAKEALKNGALRICIEAVYFDPSDLGKFIDQLFIIDAPDALIFKRVRDRKISPDELKIFFHFQRKNFPKAGVKIMNDGTEKELRQKLRQFFSSAGTS